MKLCNLKKIVTIIYLIGITLDHLTTKIGVSVFGLKESNALTGFLIENGLWVYVDIILFLSIIAIINLISDRMATSNKALLFFPLLSGFTRMTAGIRNLMIIQSL